MLQNMRDNMKGTVAFIIVGFLAFILAASLVNLSGSGSSSRFEDVAKVNGITITERELQLALGQEKQRLQAQFGDSLPAEFLADERLRQPVLQGLVQRSVLLDKAADGKMTISGSELDKLILEMPQFQTNGQFDSQLYVNGVRRIGHTPTSFRTLLKEDIVVNQLRNALASTAFVSEAELKQIMALSRQTRDFSWVTLPLADLPEKMQVSDEEIAEYYESNKQNFNTEEQVAVEYIELKVDDIAGTLYISDEEIQQQYEIELQSFSALTEREAAHIMIEGNDEAAKLKIAEVAAKLDAGDDFASLAATYSDDFGSKDNGGSLGVSSGDAFPEAFEAALLALEEGQVSPATKIDGATHFIKLVSVKEEEAPSFEEAKARIEAEMKSIQAEQIYIDKLNTLKDLAYNTENLSEVAEQLTLPLGKTQLFTRNGGSDPILNDSRVVKAAFSDQVLQQGFASDVLELAPNQAVVIKLIEHQSVRVLTLEEKTADILAALKLEKAKLQLKEQADSFKEALASGTSLESLAKENNLTVNSEINVNRDGSSQPSELISHVFSLPRPNEDKPVTSSLYLSNNDYALVSLSAVKDVVFEELSEEEQRGARLSLERSTSIDEFRAWQTLMVDKAEVDIVGSSAN